MRTCFSRIDLPSILNIDSFDPERIRSIDDDAAECEDASSHDHTAGDDSCAVCVARHQHEHDGSVRTVRCVCVPSDATAC